MIYKAFYDECLVTSDVDLPIVSRTNWSIYSLCTFASGIRSACCQVILQDTCVILPIGRVVLGFLTSWSLIAYIDTSSIGCNKVRRAWHGQARIAVVAVDEVSIVAVLRDQNIAVVSRTRDRRYRWLDSCDSGWSHRSIGRCVGEDVRCALECVQQSAAINARNRLCSRASDAVLE